MMGYSYIAVALLLAADKWAPMRPEAVVRKPEIISGSVQIKLSDLIWEATANYLRENGLSALQRIVRIIQEKDDDWRRWHWEDEWTNDFRYLVALWQAYFQYGNETLYYWAAAEKAADGSMRALSVTPLCKNWRSGALVYEFDFVEKWVGQWPKRGKLRVIAEGGPIEGGFNGHQVSMYHINIEVIASDGLNSWFCMVAAPMVYVGEHVKIKRGWLGWPKSRYLVPIIRSKPKSGDE